MTAAGLAESILSTPIVSNWSKKLQSGWIVLAGVLRCCENAPVQRLGKEGYTTGEEDDIYEFRGSTEPNDYQIDLHCGVDIHERSPWPFTHMKLGTLWASVQAELLSYRRLHTSDTWVSDRFQMGAIEEQLNSGEELEVGYATNQLLRAHCACHSFGGHPLAVLADAVDPDIANLDVWGRETYGESTNDDIF